MQITVRETARYLDVSEATVRQWIRRRGLPAHRAHERLHLNAIEVWEWAVANGVPASRSLLDRARGDALTVPPVADLLRTGGIHHDVPGADRPAVLREIVARLPLPPEADREFLLAVLEAREAMGSTGVGDGIAIPHVRNPIVLQAAEPFVTLCLLRTAVDFDAVDSVPVHALFTVVTPSVPVHLRVLAQLGFVLRDPGLRDLLRRRASAPEILAQIESLADRSTGTYRTVAREPDR
jgi:PTS system nitrogen regulatory IIA component